MISTVLKQKLQITNGTHRKRAKILKDVVPTINSKGIEVLIPGKIFEINCEINVRQLAENLYSGLPKFTTTATCTENCGGPESREKENFFIFPPEVICSKELYRNLFEFKTKKCNSAGCSGTVKTSYTGSGM